MKENMSGNRRKSVAWHFFLHNMTIRKGNIYVILSVNDESGKEQIP